MYLSRCVQNFDILPKESTFARIFLEVERLPYILTNLFDLPFRQFIKNQLFKNLYFSSPVKAVPEGTV